MKAADVVIHEALTADVEALADVGLASFRATYASTASETDLESHLERYFSVAAIRNEMSRPDQGYLIARVDQEPVGLAKWRFGYCPDEVPESNSIEIQQLYILPGNQRHGLGGRLVAAVIDIAERRAARGIWLSVWEHADWAIRFYSKTGFREVGKAGFKVGETLHTDLVMWLPLT